MKNITHSTYSYDPKPFKGLKHKQRTDIWAKLQLYTNAPDERCIVHILLTRFSTKSIIIIRIASLIASKYALRDIIVFFIRVLRCKYRII